MRSSGPLEAGMAVLAARAEIALRAELKVSARSTRTCIPLCPAKRISSRRASAGLSSTRRMCSGLVMGAREVAESFSQPGVGEADELEPEVF